MEAIAVQQKPAVQAPLTALKPAENKRISWEEFQNKFLSREDAFKYEWVDGMVEKTKRTMDWTQLYIIRNLQALFRQLSLQGKVSGEFICEVDTFFVGNHRRPDIAWFSDAQIDLTLKGIIPMPEFIVEVISTHDAINRVNKKMKNYRAAGVKVVWQIFPEEREVHVCTGTRLQNIKVRSGKELCSAAPVLPDFVLTVQDIFKQP